MLHIGEARILVRVKAFVIKATGIVLKVFHMSRFHVKVIMNQV